MPEYSIKILSTAYSDIDAISDFHLRMVGAVSAEKITDKLLDSILRLEKFPFLGSEHSDPVLRNKEFRKLVCGEYVCIYKIIDTTICIYAVLNGALDYAKMLY